MTAIARNPDDAINNDIATVRDAFKRYEAETGVDPSTLPREQQREIALGGLNALAQGAAPTASLSGKEVSESFNSDTAVADARAWFKANLQGRPIVRDGFGTVRVSSASFKKLKQGLTRDPLKLQLLPAIRPLIERGEYGGRRAVSKSRPDNIVAFHSFEGNVALGDTTVRARVLVGEDADGTLLFNLYPDSSTKKQTPRPDPRNRSPGAEGLPDEQAILNENLAQDEDGIKIIQAPAAGGVSDSGAALNQSGDDGFSEEGRKQARDVERAYGGRQGYERDKAAGRTKLTYGQWVQVRTPNFLRWFGDWLALRAQQRLDAMEPVKVRVPEDWRGLSHVELRQKMAEALDRMVRDRTGIEHPELGTIRVGRTGASKSVNTARDPAKSLVAADIEALIPASIYARSEPSRGGDGKDIDGYSTLLARIEVDGIPLIAAFTVRHQSDGQWYYNAVTLHDGNKKARDSYGQPDQDGSSHAPIAGLAEFVRRQLIRVNPAEVSKVIDPKTGEPLVVYHGTPNATFDSFKDGAHFTEDADYAAVYMHPSASSINAEEKRADAAAIYPVYLAIQHPFDTRDPAIRAVFDREFFGKWGNATPLTDRGLPDWTDSRDLLEWIEETDQPFDGLILDEGGTPEGGHRGLSYVPVKPAQIKSATANNGDFSEDPNILKQADGNKKAPRGQIVGRDGQSIIGQKAENGTHEFNITLFEGKDLSTVLRATQARRGHAVALDGAGAT